MKILQVYNQYRSMFNGEETVVFQTVELLRKHGDDAHLVMRTSRGIEDSLAKKAQAFFSGVYSPSARRDMTTLLQEERPDIVHVHNLYPLFSPSVLVACRQQKTPVVMSLHNQNLTCPKADHLYQGEVCERCTGGGGELNCLIRNCRSNIVESAAYALRSAVARKFGLFQENITRFIALSQFAKNRLVQNGYRAEQIEILPNMVEASRTPTDPALGQFVAFAGRMSPEKGVETLLTCASKTPAYQFELAGGGPLQEKYENAASSNVRFRGQLSQEDMHSLYRGARMLVLPSHCFEMCPLVIMEAMAHGLPVVASRIGGLGELVDDGETGLLFEPGNADDLAEKIDRIWRDPQLARRFGRAGYEKANREYSEPRYYQRLKQIYSSAIDEIGAAGDEGAQFKPETVTS